VAAFPLIVLFNMLRPPLRLQIPPPDPAVVLFPLIVLSMIAVFPSAL
jgi:hypothetical protein